MKTKEEKQKKFVTEFDIVCSRRRPEAGYFYALHSRYARI